MTLSGHEGLTIRSNVLKVALEAVREGLPGAGASARRLARSLRATARNYGIAEIIEAAWAAEDAPEEHLAEALAELVDVLEATVESTETRPAVILLVEDDPAMVRLLQAVVKGPGHEVVAAASLKEAGDILATRPVSLVVLDIHLPDGDGRDLLVRLREQAPTASLPVVVLSAESRAEMKAECLALGADEYLEKTAQAPVLGAAISAKIRREAESTRISRRDPLTGLPNRQAFEVAFEQFRLHARRTRRPMALAMIDLDHFKTVNDTYGHLMGDEVLTRVARVLGRSLRESDFIARWGGEELVVMFPDTAADGAHSALLKALETLRQEVFAADTTRTFRVTFSAGVVEVVPEAGLAAAVQSADKLLYAAKAAGRDRVEVAVAP